jgi:hypothetical protein
MIRNVAISKPEVMKPRARVISNAARSRDGPTLALILGTGSRCGFFDDNALCCIGKYVYHRS